MRNVTKVAAIVALAGSIAAQSDRYERLVAELGHPKRASHAARELVTSGSAAVAPLLRMLRRDFAREDDRASVCAILAVLRDLGADAKEATPALLELLNWSTDERRLLVVEALGEIGPHFDDQSEVETVLEHAVIADHRSWLDALANFSRNAEKDSKASGKRPPLPQHSAIAYCRLGVKGDAPVTVLMELLSSDPNPIVRGVAADLLGQRDGCEEIAAALAVALHAEQPTQARVVMTLERLQFGLRLDGNRIVRVRAAKALAAKYSQRDEAIDACAILLRDGSPHEQWTAAMALAQRGQDAARAVPVLITGLSSDDVTVLCACITALGATGPAAEAALPRVRELVDHSDADVSSRAVSLLNAFTRRAGTVRG